MARQQDGDTLRLKRERAGRYVTADGRFAVEGDAAGAWYVIDSARHDGLGLPLVRGPFPTLDAARAAVAEAQGAAGDLPGASAPPAIAVAPKRHVKAVPASTESNSTTTAAAPTPAASRTKSGSGARAEPGRGQARLRAVEAAPPPPAEPTLKAARPSASEPAPEVGPARAAPPKEAPAEGPAWMGRLTPDQRTEARRLLALLDRAGIDDPALVRREIEAGLPEVARALLARTVRQAAIDPWAAGPDAVESLAARAGSSPARARDPRTRAARAAAGRLLARADADDLGLLAWLVALDTAVRIFDALGGEGRDAGQGLRGWRLDELGAGRAPTGRTLAIDEPDLLGE